jgi:hypothetical protein
MLYSKDLTLILLVSSDTFVLSFCLEYDFQYVLYTVRIVTMILLKCYLTKCHQLKRIIIGRIVAMLKTSKEMIAMKYFLSKVFRIHEQFAA